MVISWFILGHVVHEHKQLKPELQAEIYLPVVRPDLPEPLGLLQKPVRVLAVGSYRTVDLGRSID